MQIWPSRDTIISDFLESELNNIIVLLWLIFNETENGGFQISISNVCVLEHRPKSWYIVTVLQLLVSWPCLNKCF